jgi:acetylornithine/succinyldiaminopimelate/putrescine aminotransferase
VSLFKEAASRLRRFFPACESVDITFCRAQPLWALHGQALAKAGIGSTLDALRAMPKRTHLAREEEDSGVRIARSRGTYMFDNRRRKYVDFLAGWCVGNFGWNNPLLERARRSFTGPDYVYPNHSYAPWEELAGLLARIAPAELTMCYRATGGSEAVDIALQAAMVHTGRSKFVSLEDAYHGNTIAAMSVGGDAPPGLLRKSHKISLPLDAGALGRVETQLKRRDVAAFIMEPVPINLGVENPDSEFMEGLSKLCKRYGTLLIMDEVATGFGRTGQLFASEHYNIEPDIMTLGKAITGGVAGMGAVISTDEVAESMQEDGSFYSTYGWHPLSTHIAIANVRWIIANKRRLLDGVARMSGYFRDRLSEMDFGREVKLRIRGLAIGVDVGDEDYADELVDKCRRGGVLLTNEGSVITMLPALTIDRAAAKRGLDIFEESLATRQFSE